MHFILLRSAPSFSKRSSAAATHSGIDSMRCSCWFFYAVIVFIAVCHAASFAPDMKQSLRPLSLMSWNVNGLRALIKHDPDGAMLRDLLKRREVDVLCLQETKIQTTHVTELDVYMKETFGAHSIYWSCSTARKGYSGTAVLLFDNNNGLLNKADHRINYAINEEFGDLEGRAITMETDRFSLVNVYVPNSGSELLKLPYRVSAWDVKLAQHINDLKTRRPHVPVILMGDLNVAHRSLDYHNAHQPITKRQPGTTPQEQESFQSLLLHQCGLVDTFRAQHPTRQQYSFFSALLGERGRRYKLGMRLDYVLASLPDLSPHHCATATPSDVAPALDFGAYIEDQLSHPYSDHCPQYFPGWVRKRSGCHIFESSREFSRSRDATTPIDSALQVLSLVEQTQNEQINIGLNVPVVTIAYAQTLDGTISPIERSRMNISSSLSFQLLHSLRAKNDAIMIGTGTLKYDNPRLNVRSVFQGVNVPAKSVRPVLLDSQLSIVGADVISLEKPIIFTCVDPKDLRWSKAISIVKRLGGELVTCNSDENGRCNISHCLKLLHTVFGIRCVLVEGGAGVIQTVLEQGLCDQLVVTLRPGYFGGYRCMTDQLQRGMVSLQNISVASVGGDIVVHGQLQRGGAGTTDLNAMRAPVALIRERGQKIAKLLRLLFAGAILFSSVLIIVCGILRL